MTTKIEAIYEHGVLRPRRPLPLEDGTQVDVLILSEDKRKTVKKPRAPQDKRTPAQIMTEIAALPMESGGKEFSGRDHDRILYGAKGGR
jgi:predicted DNA-binding antitoxin AbrB/MazE fold protein